MILVHSPIDSVRLKLVSWIKENPTTEDFSPRVENASYPLIRFILQKKNFTKIKNVNVIKSLHRQAILGKLVYQTQEVLTHPTVLFNIF